MTTLSRPNYDDDFYAWTQDQAAALRDLAPGLAGPKLDIDRIADEIEDLGKHELREVESALRQLLVRFLKLHALPQAQERARWIAEAGELQVQASEAYRPSMRGALDLPRAWASARRSAATILAEMGGTPSSLPTACPFDLDTLVSPDFDVHAALSQIVYP